MLTKQGKKHSSFKSTKNWLAVISLLVFLTTLQCSKILNINGIKPDLIFSLATVYFMFNNVKNSSIFAIICGFFMDCFSERALGFSSLFLLISCVLISCFCKQFMQIKFLSFIFLNSTLFLLFELFNFIALYVSLKFKNIWFIWINHIFPISALTILISPLFYLIYKQFYKFLKKNQFYTT